MVQANVNVNDVKSKFKTKKDLWMFLAYEAGVYLPPEKHCTVYFLKQIFANEKKVSLINVLV